MTLAIFLWVILVYWYHLGYCAQAAVATPINTLGQRHEAKFSIDVSVLSQSRLAHSCVNISLR